MTLFELNWHFNDEEVLSHLTVTPIAVEREEGDRIFAIDHKGFYFQGSRRDYFASEKEAWDKAVSDLIGRVIWKEDKILRLSRDIENCKKFLQKLEGEGIEP